MARSVGSTIENNFVNGLVTEATGLNFPENACIETWNCEFDKTGKVTRRKGFQYEPNYETFSQSRNAKAFANFTWESASLDGNVTIVVQQIGAHLYFFRVTGNTALSSELLNVGSLTTLARLNQPCSFTAGMGYLLVAHPDQAPQVWAYDRPTNTVLLRGTITMQVRDMVGIESDPAANTALTYEHQYNLTNQGWHSGYWNQFAQRMGRYPNNYEITWALINADGVFAPNEVPHDFGNTLAPRGRVIFNWNNIDRGSYIGVNLPQYRRSTSRQPTCIEFYAGRAWFAGINDAAYSNSVYFSQIIESQKDIDTFGKCYQHNDPTAEDTNQLLPTDGGELQIPEAATIIRLFAMDGMLLVFATNGVWGITGSQGTGFLANDFTVKRLSAIGCISSHSFIDSSGVPIWWNEQGIWTVKVEAAVGNTQVISLTEKSLKDFFLNEIPDLSKRFAKGVLDQTSGLIQWLYRSTAPTNNQQRYEYDRVLTLNTQTGAFYPWSIDTTTHKIHGIVSVKGVYETRVEEDVTTTDGTVITNSALEDIEFISLDVDVVASGFKYLTSTGTPTSSSFTFANCDDETWMDWDSTDYESYFISGYKVRGEAQKKSQLNYITVYSDTRETNTRCHIQGLWDYTTGSSTGRWTQRQVLDYDQDLRAYSKRRVKIRGHGVACQIKIQSIEGEPFEIVGWSTMESVNATP